MGHVNAFWIITSMAYLKAVRYILNGGKYHPMGTSMLIINGQLPISIRVIRSLPFYALGLKVPKAVKINSLQKSELSFVTITQAQSGSFSATTLTEAAKGFNNWIRHIGGKLTELFSGVRWPNTNEFRDQFIPFPPLTQGGN